MSQKTTRKGVPEEKEKRQTDSPVKEMKKKMAANSEKEKQAAAAEKSEAQPEKPADKQEKATKQAEKTVEKTPEKSKDDKKVEKNDKPEKDKKNEKPAEKKEAEKPKDDKAEKSAKKKQNGHGDAPSTNGTGLNGTEADLNGTDAELNGRVSDEDVEHEDDELFPELTYDDSEDSFEPPTPDGVPSRSFTRRSQAKLTRTPETPRPASAKHEPAEDSKESKVLKMKDDPLATDRKLRSADSPKPESKKEAKKDETQEKKGDTHEKKEDTQEKKGDSQEKKETQEKSDDAKKEDGKEEKGDKKESEKDKDKMEVEVVIEVDAEAEGTRKPDTNFSKSRVKVSPYRRSMRLADQTTSSVMANYTGNNTTMEMDISETSSFMAEEPSLDDSYLSGLRSIRGRRSYKPLKEMSLRSVTANRSTRSATSVTAALEHPARPTGTVVGRKRKPDAEDFIELASSADTELVGSKRMRLLDRIAQPFRRTTLSNAGVSRRAADIVGINTDLPLTAPVASPATFDPEALKPAAAGSAAVPPPAVCADREKRCSIM